MEFSGEIEHLNVVSRDETVSQPHSNPHEETESLNINSDQISLNVELYDEDACVDVEQALQLDVTMSPESSLSGLAIQKQNERCEHTIEYASTLAHLALFGILGVLIRYWLDVLYGDVLSITAEGTIVYRDLPPNMVGSFFMGWVGIVLKQHLVSYSKPLAIGLSTGLMGSITTYAAWNQKMVEMFSSGHVITALSGYLTGKLLAQMSLQLGIDSALGLKQVIPKLLAKFKENGEKGICVERVTMNTFPNSIIILAVSVFVTLCMWVVSLCLLVKGIGSQKLQVLYLGCIVAPPGVWIRWYLARLNGRGLGSKLKWLPIGTLLANMLGASFDAIFRFLQVSNNADLVLLDGLQLGLMGCLSTVSTFVAEVHFMYVGGKKLKAYTYAVTTLVLGFILGIFLYSTPSWVTGHNVW